MSCLLFSVASGAVGRGPWPWLQRPPGSSPPPQLPHRSQVWGGEGNAVFILGGTVLHHTGTQTPTHQPLSALLQHLLSDVQGKLHRLWSKGQPHWQSYSCSDASNMRATTLEWMASIVSCISSIEEGRIDLGQILLHRFFNRSVLVQCLLWSMQSTGTTWEWCESVTTHHALPPKPLEHYFHLLYIYRCIQRSLVKVVESCSSNLSIIHQEISTPNMQGTSNFQVKNTPF